jgi:hypothetical protein
MSKYTSLPAKADFVLNVIEDNYHFFDDNFKAFMFDMIRYVNEIHGMKLNNPDYEILKKNSS